MKFICNVKSVHNTINGVVVWIYALKVLFV